MTFHFAKNTSNNAGFTMFELVVVVAILLLLLAIAISNYASFEKNSDLNNGVQEFVSILKLAQNETLSSTSYTQYGVYINTAVSPNRYVLFQGATYATRVHSADQTYTLPVTLAFYGISLGGGSEIAFDRLTGASDESGSVSLRVKADTSQNKTIYIASSGAVGFTTPVSPSDANRVKDSRHVQFNYSRTIDTVNEYITLNFNNSEDEIIPINLYLVGGELQWQGTLSVGGSNQIVQVSTHRLNNPDTLFSIHRDGRYNNKSLKVTISGDSSGYLAQYSADGLTTSSSSAYVSNFAWQ